MDTAQLTRLCPPKECAMSSLDPRSFILVSGLLGILCIIVLIILGRTFPKPLDGLREWIWACGLMVVAALLFTAHGTIPVFFSSFFANITVIAGIMMMHASLRRFAGQAPMYRSTLVLLVLVSSLLAWSTLVDPNYQNRVILVTAVNLSVFFACAGVIFSLPQNSLAERFTAWIFVLTGLVSLTRLVASVGGHDSWQHADDRSLLQTAYLATFSFSVVALTIGFMLMISKRLHSRLEYLASHDTLSGTYSRGTFFEFLEVELQHTRQHRDPLSLLMIDLDDFKSVNDRFGHPVGDRVLVDFSNRMKSVLRARDFSGRYGGEEFAVLLPNTGIEEARLVAERIRSRVAAASDPPYTVSIGITTTTDGLEALEALVTRADRALYLAKKNGKNQVHAALPSDASSAAAARWAARSEQPGH